MATTTTPKRSITAGRAIALVVIATLVAGLAAMRFGGKGDVEVPRGAKAGHFELEPCTYETEAGKVPADCGTLVVPENRADPKSRLIALPVTRIRAKSRTPKEPIFRLEGGPGQTNMKFPQASRFTGERDVVLVGYRGVDGSADLQCPEVVSALKGSADLLGQRSMRAYARAFRTCSSRLRDEGYDLAGYTFAERVDDLEAARTAMGYERVDLLSESMGTRIAQIYGRRHPSRIRRSVMVAVNPPGRFLWDGAESDAQLRRYAELCRADAKCAERTPDLAASMRRSAGDMPERWLHLPIKPGNVKLASFYGMMESTVDGGMLAAPTVLDAWLANARGDASGFWAMSLMADVAFPESFVWGDVAAASRNDVTFARERFAGGGKSDAVLGDAGTRFTWADGRLIDGWPAAPGENDYDRARTSNVETLLVSGELDGATPARFAREELLPHLPNGKHVVIEAFGHTLDFWNSQEKAGTKLINTFYASGQVDDSGYARRPIEFAPESRFGGLARTLLAVMIGLPLIAVAALAGLRRRVNRRGRIGRPASVLLRSLFPIVLGLGGWLGTAMIVMTVRPETPIGGAILSTLSVAAPVAAGIYLAWARRDRSPETSAAGLRLAAAGAVTGAWLGFHAGAGFVALATTIAGAAIGANLALLAFDIARDRAAQQRAAEAATASRVVVPA